MFQKVILLLLISCLSGCAAVAMRMDYDHPCPYKGVRLDWWLVGTSHGKLIPFLLIDAPFSLVVDTVFFPFEYQYSCND
ncbi:YceK/YidQ family lipoprotein [Pseudomonas chlororaphis]|uniref:YceK/YidQ family lipoprotein n=1 Tax=Pseudomonas chlororaphis subsp. aurantiaca TaxID=86192 RepID=A0AAJ0ZEW5_9PSED|nr:YceK/YidQ family lipoprotein [Pseudomonas chlororaphis]AZD73860.1 lipoprotein, putative [Pseudomonas chlororaphis subsp. aurantiaca]AZD80093.1 lipoprotein, putative [Pseudomonas chlororaphis subsp. aurantiaca]MBU4631243.1 YceK/YidQ family lipoprotein [Pseudomonas chlororaphis subsp. aurantiaca]